MVRGHSGGSRYQEEGERSGRRWSAQGRSPRGGGVGEDARGFGCVLRNGGGDSMIGMSRGGRTNPGLWIVSKDGRRAGKGMCELT